MRRVWRIVSAALALGVVLPAGAQTIVTSAAPDSVSVTIYRDADRNPQAKMERDSPQGFALITETRTVTLPAGRAVIRFEGVAGNILPETALIAGLPGGVAEKNLDADLLSPRSLFDRALGRRVMVRRTDPATGKATLRQAVIRSSAAGAAVLDLGGSYGDYQCSGLPEALVYDGIPPGLSAKPTLSVQTDSPSEQRVTLTLSYLAGGFDWQADYIVTMRRDGRSADLFSWITLASTDVTSFADAQMQVVAGRPNREREARPVIASAGGELHLQCWPLPEYNFNSNEPVNLPMMAPPAPAPMAMDIVVTAQRRVAKLESTPLAVTAVSEQLGDLKLYRFPVRVTVASQAQKQVAMLSKPGVKLAPVYIGTISRDQARTGLVLRGRNSRADGLGVPLPAGRATVWTKAGDRTLLIGESSIDDNTIDEKYELRMGESQSVKSTLEVLRQKGGKRGYRLTVTNPNSWPIDYEGRFGLDDGVRLSSGQIVRRDGRDVWIVRVPANGTATLSYGITDPPERD